MVGKGVPKNRGNIFEEAREGLNRMDTENTALQSQEGKELATLGGGCFWCLEAVYSELKGVEQLVSGYAGGTVPNPTYEQICEEDTGHAEVVQITFDPREISYKELLQVFFTIHDPTTVNRQGPDVGPQYRSAIFYHNPEQQRIAEDTIRELTTARVWDSPIVTEIVPLEVFYPAEDYHQQYFERNPTWPYCQFVVVPKVMKARKVFADKLKR
jgi:peptide-methionine (S)-S-oxide reductase